MPRLHDRTGRLGSRSTHGPGQWWAGVVVGWHTPGSSRRSRRTDGSRPRSIACRRLWVRRVRHPRSDTERGLLELVTGRDPTGVRELGRDAAGPFGPLHRSSTDGQDLERLTANPYGGGDFPGDFSPDGARYVFPRENPQRDAVALFVVNADGSGANRLTPWMLNAGGRELVARRRADPVRSGRHLLAVAGRHGDHPHRDGHRRLSIRSRAGRPTARASCSRCTCARRTRSSICTVAADGSDLQQVTDTRPEDGFADWSPA